MSDAKNRPTARILGVFALFAVSTAACAHAQKPKPCTVLPIAAHLSSAEMLNPNAEGQPSPVEIKVLLLAERQTFDALDFQTLWKQAEALLAADLVKASTFVVLPAEEKLWTVQAPTTARYVALLPLYRQPSEEDWHAVFDIGEQALRCREGDLHIPIRATLRDNRILTVTNGGG